VKKKKNSKSKRRRYEKIGKKLKRGNKKERK